MKKDLNHIEDLFKNKFDGFEANVDPSVWANIQNNIGGTNVAATSVSKALLTKIIAGVVIATGLATSTYYLLSKENKSKPNTLIDEKIASKSLIVDAKEKITEENNIQNKELIIENIGQLKSSILTNSVGVNKSIQEKAVAINTNTEPIKTENSTVEKTNLNQQNNNQAEKKNTQENSKNIENAATEQVKINIKIKASTLKGNAPLDVEFDADGDAVAYSWDFGDGSEISGQETSFHTFSAPGKYLVKLTAIDNNANSKTVVQLVTVESNVKSLISPIQTVFSPNGDGINDILKIEGENIKEFSAIVRDSKGNLVFEWKSMEGFWDGRDLNNQVLAKGVYYVVVEAVGSDGEKHSKKQSIQLF